jgi:cell division septal protein FtsQ
MRRRYKKQYKAKRRGGIFRSKFFWFSFLALIFLGTGVDVLFFSSLFQIGNIKVEGNQRVSMEEIKNIISKGADKKFGFVESKSIFLTGLNKISGDILKEIPQIAKINLIRNFPNTISAQVVERIPSAVFCESKKCFLMDNGGVVYEETNEIPANMPRITNADFNKEIELGEAPLTGEQMDYILKIASQIKVFNLSATEFLIKSDTRLNVKTSEGWQIYLNPQKDIDKQLKNLGIILKEKLPIEKRKNLAYIDFRFDRIYIYPEGL